MLLSWVGCSQARDISRADTGTRAVDVPTSLAQTASEQERWWRVSHDEGAGRAAIRSLEDTGLSPLPSNPCRGPLRAASIRAEIEGAPDLLHRFAAMSLLRGGGDECLASLRRATVHLAAFASASHPSPALLPGHEDYDEARGRTRLLSMTAFGASVTGVRLVLGLSAPAEFALEGSTAGNGLATSRGTRAAPGTLHLRLLGVGGPMPHELRPFGLVTSARASPSRGGTNVAITMNKAGSARAFALADPFRVVIDVRSLRSSREPSVEPRQIRRVAIDAGHGGADPGAQGPSGLRESDITLDIAHRLAPILSRELGIAILLTRDSDETVPLEARVARANAFHADLFISIHLNAAAASNARGFMSFVLDRPRQPSVAAGSAPVNGAPRAREPSAAEVAARENQSTPTGASALAEVIDEDPPEQRRRSQKLAELVQTAILSSVRPTYAEASDLGVQTAGFYVLAGAQMPSVLCECGFISNRAEEAQLALEEFRQQVANGLFNAIRAYRDGR